MILQPYFRGVRALECEEICQITAVVYDAATEANDRAGGRLENKRGSLMTKYEA